jgi:hypothetical protein
MTAPALAADVVINEVHCNTGYYYDNCEFIELRNMTGSSIDLSHWMICGVDYDETCCEHRHVFPPGSSIDANGYFVIARDMVNADSSGFWNRFRLIPDLEMYDASQYYEVDDAGVPNTQCRDRDDYDDQIRLYPGPSDYGYRCPYVGEDQGRYEVLYLYSDSLGTTLVDAMEYRESYCQQDMCTANGTGDAYPRYPDEGITLGRDETQPDTDNSAVDFHEMAPTPGSANLMTLPPRVWTLRYSPCIPEPLTDNIDISVYAWDDDGTIASVVCYVDIDSTGYVAYPMSATPGDSFYTCTVPPQADQSQGMFYVIATDNLAATTTYPGDAPQGSYHFSIGLTAISIIQGTFRPNITGTDSSGYAGQAKNITGVVTVGRGEFYSNDALFVVQQGFGNYSGIYVYDPTYSVPAERGDEVELAGLVTEYYKLTELRLFTGCYEEVATGVTLPSPLVVSTNSLNTATPGAERYEGVLVRVENVTVTNDSLGYGEWEVNDGSGPCRVDDDCSYFYTPKTGDVLEAVQGVCNYTFDDYKIEPRGDEDIVGPPAIYNLVYTPHAPTSSDQITVSCTVLGDNPISTVKLFYSITGGAPFDSLVMTSPDSVYTVQIGPYPNNTVVDYYVEVWDNSGYSARKPTAGTYDFRVGMNTIYQVQFFRDAGGDSSALAGEPVNLSGIVTAGTGEFSDYYFYIQNSYGGPDTPAFDGVKVYDRTGTVSVARGDSITISGDVWEYYNETEIAMFFPEAITYHPDNTTPAPYAVTPTSIDTQEDWEGVLVAAIDVVVSDDDIGFGEWMIAANGNPADTCRVGDDAYYTYNPLLGESLAYVYGVGAYAYGRYILQPRDDDDICAASEAGIEDAARATKIMMMVKPNPMMDGGTVRFSVPAAGRVALKIYNVQGELVKTLLEGSVEAGSHKIDWRSTNDRGNRVTSGIYFIRLDTRSGSVVNKVVVSR